jgi:hypothetical protein
MFESGSNDPFLWPTWMYECPDQTFLITLVSRPQRQVNFHWHYFLQDLRGGNAGKKGLTHQTSGYYLCPTKVSRGEPEGKQSGGSLVADWKVKERKNHCDCRCSSIMAQDAPPGGTRDSGILSTRQRFLCKPDLQEPCVFTYQPAKLPPKEEL